MSFEFLNQLPTPADIKRDYPLSPELRELKKHRDLMISDVITGKDSQIGRASCRERVYHCV